MTTYSDRPVDFSLSQESRAADIEICHPQDLPVRIICHSPKIMHNKRKFVLTLCGNAHTKRRFRQMGKNFVWPDFLRVILSCHAKKRGEEKRNLSRKSKRAKIYGSIFIFSTPDAFNSFFKNLPSNIQSEQAVHNKMNRCLPRRELIWLMFVAFGVDRGDNTEFNHVLPWPFLKRERKK